MFPFLRGLVHTTVNNIKPTPRDPQMDGVMVEKAQIERNTAHLEYMVTANRLRPCHSYPIKISHDGMRWSCISLGCAEAIGYGDSPGESMAAFDKMWLGNGGLGG